MKTLYAFLLIILAGAAHAAAPLPPGVSKAYLYRQTNGLIYQQFTCDYPTQRADGTAFDPTTEMAGIQWIARYYATWGAPYEVSGRVQAYDPVDGCTYWSPLDGREIDVRARTKDLNDLWSADSVEVPVRWE